MKKSILLLVFISFFTQILFSQKEAVHWYFGEGAGLDFSTGSLKLDPNGLMDASHGSTAMSDGNGNLLFYTNGNLVWNKKHKLMPNGVLVDSCAGTFTMQNCVIVPKVEDENKFYLFTIQTINGGNKGLRYNVVDMTLDNNNGDISETSIPVIDSLLVGCAVTKHSNGSDYWVAVRAITLVSNLWHEKWLSFLIDKNGVNLASTYLGNPLDLNTAMSGKFSPNGKYLYWGGKVYDFDNTSGEIINYRSLVEWSSTYTNGEFSPNNDIIYVTSHGSTSFSLDQFDLNSSQLIASKIAIDFETDGNTHIKGGLQLAPDGKIYVSYLNNIGVIHYPNKLGIACSLEQNSINVPGKAWWCFPNFSSHYFNNLMTTETVEIINDNSNLQIFPNPANKFININQTELIYTNCELMNLNAVKFDHVTITNNFTKLDVSNLPKGLYILKLYNENSIHTRKIFVN